MTKSIKKRAKWTAPQVKDITDGLSVIQNGVLPGSDGDGGYSTSLS